MMQALDYILKDIKPIRITDKVEKVQILFKQVNFTHLPVINKDIFCGSLAKSDLEFFNNTDQKIDQLKNVFKPLYVFENFTWFEVLQTFANNNCNLLPVLDMQKKYIGYYELDDFLNIFNCTTFLHEEGVILTISKGVNDYSFSEISQIVESNNATLFGIFVSKIENDTATITLKLSLHDINNTMISFRRYGYLILTETHEDKYLENLKDRSDYLEKFLNI
ncbi:MAG: CBS domain-containing protein [Bacteroidota bacterium]